MNVIGKLLLKVLKPILKSILQSIIEKLIVICIQVLLDLITKWKERDVNNAATEEERTQKNKLWEERINDINEVFQKEKPIINDMIEYVIDDKLFYEIKRIEN